MPQLYVYKCKDDPYNDNNAYGNWGEVFDDPNPVRWGGVWATRNLTSIAIFRDELQVGDLILAWQTDESAAVGVAEVVGFETAEQGTRDGVMKVEHVVLKAVERFPQPVRLHELKKTTNPELAAVPSLKQGNVATIYRTSRAHAYDLLRACNSRYADDYRDNQIS